LEHLHREFQLIRGGKPDIRMFDHLQVEAYGSVSPLSTVAQVALKTPKLATISVFDPSLISSVLKAIQRSDMNLNPQSEGGTVSIPIPKLTSEVRNDLTKKVAALAEDAKKALRSHRKKTIDSLKTAEDDGAPEDDIRKEKTLIDSLVHLYIELIEDLASQKEQEIMET